MREQHPPAEDVDYLYPICQDVCGESSSSGLKKTVPGQAGSLEVL